MKLYVKETWNRNSDGDLHVTLEVYTSRPERFTYILFQ